ncbi:glycerate kinase [Neobacillus drentensis]|uniref:glycerate kinase n=1 Tax=Neobacillus drentensis TaxID=220684 RepID=UPI002FFF0AA4
MAGCVRSTGGLGAGLMVFLNAHLKKGVELVIEYTGLEERVEGADYVFTGEGSIDGKHFILCFCTLTMFDKKY